MLRAPLTALVLLALSVAGQSCSAVTSPAPCGQRSDTAELCLAKGCCYTGNSSAAYPCFYPGGDAVPIKFVHVVQASHFDAGFAYTIRDVLQLWWYTHFPRALRLGLEIEAGSYPAGTGLQFMAQCWLIALFFDCPPGVPGLTCPTPAQAANLTLAIQKGFLTWHAFPFNSEAELHDAGMLRAGVDVCHALDDRFGFARKSTMSQRDVPGTTRAVVPVLAAANVTAFSIGVNGASTPPFVPRAFVWEDEASGASMPMLVHPYGYGGLGYEDAVIVPGLEHALVTEWLGDNQGPPDSVAQIVGDFAGVARTFPGAAVFSSTFDNFTQHLRAPAVLQQLPVIRAELGDTWIHGAPSDVIRLAYFKRAGVLAAACRASGQCSASDPVFANFTLLLLKCGEHTWGKDIKGFLHDTNHWRNSELQAQLAANAPNFVDVVNSWQEQRDWCATYSLAALTEAGHPLAPAVAAALADLTPAAPPSPAAEGYAPYAANTVYAAGRWSIGFDGATGAISTLADAGSGQTWASPGDGSLLAYTHYVSLSAADIATLTGPYPLGYYPLPGASPDWFQKDFGKPNVSEASPLHQEVPQALTSLWLRENATTASFLVAAAFADPALHAYYGAPAAVWLRVDVPRGSGAAAASIACTLEIYNKTATRLPEGFFLRFQPSRSYASSPAPLAWAAGKLGSSVDPFNVVQGGNHHLHGFTGGIAATKKDPAGKGEPATLAFASDDAGVASFGRPWPIPAPVWANSSSADDGAGFCLTTNTWGTNYPAWVPFLSKESNMRWRFTITAS